MIGYAALALFIYTVAAFGLAYILGHAEISRPFRERIYRSKGWRYWIVTLMECPACCGFWIGLAAGIVGVTWALYTFPVPGDPRWSPVSIPIIPAFYTCGANYLLARATGLTPKV